MSDPARTRINIAFDEELAAAPVPAGLRPLSVRAAVTTPRPGSKRPLLVALVAIVVGIALIATLVVGSQVLRTVPAPAHSTTPPPPRAHASLVFDQAHGVVVLFGGGTGAESSSAGCECRTLNEIWTWDGKLWTHLRPAVSPSPRYEASMAYDAAHHNVLLFGGLVRSASDVNFPDRVDDTWTWNGTNWRQEHPQHHPAFSVEWPTAMLFDPLTSSVLLYGATGTNRPNPETWSWNGFDWLHLTPARTPTIITGAGFGTMAFDGRRVLLLSPSGGWATGSNVTETWAWNGSTWNALRPRVNLPPVGALSAAFDPERGQLVALLGETWTWDGSSWTRQHPTLQPPTVGYMAYVPSLHEVVAWGDVLSSDDNALYGWTGSDWNVIAPGTVTNGLVPQELMTPDQGVAAIRAAVVNARPVLLPTFLAGAGHDAIVVARSDSFSIWYQSDDRDEIIELGIQDFKPFPSNERSTDVHLVFRGHPAEYFVYDPTMANSLRLLRWIEPGKTTNLILASPDGIPYVLSAVGLTDKEFWQVADSLR